MLCSSKVGRETLMPLTRANRFTEAFNPLPGLVVDDGYQPYMVRLSIEFFPQGRRTYAYAQVTLELELLPDRPTGVIDIQAMTRTKRLYAKPFYLTEGFKSPADRFLFEGLCEDTLSSKIAHEAVYIFFTQYVLADPELHLDKYTTAYEWARKSLHGGSDAVLTEQGQDLPSDE